MNVLIVEDEDFAADKLVDLLNASAISCKVLGIVDTVEAAIDFIRKNEQQIDLAFFDIQLADGRSFEIFKQVNFSKPVIFTTAYDQYALDAFKVNSIDYLLKPIQNPELEAALKKFEGLKQYSPLPLELLEKFLKKEKAYKTRFLVKYASQMYFKEVEDIAIIRADDKLCHIIEHQTSHQYLIDQTLEELDGKLLDPVSFFRINRKFIVNIKAIKKIKRHNNGQYEILINNFNDDKLIVSRSRVNDFKNWIDA